MNHRQRHPRIILGTLALAGWGVGLAVIGDAPSAQANDDKIFAPHSCVPLDADQDDDFGGARYSVAEIRQNDLDENDEPKLGEYQTFLCPLVRDVVTGELDDVWVRARNTDPDDQTPPICCVHSLSIDTSLQDFECQVAPNTTGSTSMHLTLGDFSEYDYGDYVVACGLGFGDAIISIRTSEDS